MKNKIKQHWKRIISYLLLFVIFTVGAGYIYLKANTYEAMPEAMALLQDEAVTVEDSLIIVEPENPVGNIVFYQGGLVETEAYLPLAKKMSEKGYRVFIPYMPLNLAILGINRFEDIIEANPSEDNWWIGGHSLGGTSGVLYAVDSQDQMDGVLLLGSYPSDNADLSQSDLTVLSVDASNDQIINRERYEAAKALLPQDTAYHVIEGGNHSNFGYYGLQDSDGKSEITREAQLKQVVDAFLEIAE